MKTLIVCYSFTQNNELLARYLQRKLVCDLHKIEEVRSRRGISILLDLIFNRKPKIKPSPFHVDAYDLCIFVAPVWAGKIALPLKTFLLEKKYHINQYAFITVCGGGNPGQKDNLFRQLTGVLEQEPVALTELWVNNLLPSEKKDTIRYTSGYRMQGPDLEAFAAEIDSFIKKLEDTQEPVATVVKS
jgi:flavodoxin